MDKIENWSIGYALVRPITQIVFRLAHKDIVVNGLDNIPKGKPVIYAPNHQNALMDAMAFVDTAPEQVVFLARADIFKNKIIAKILRFLKIMPVYRIRDGKESLDKNEEIFNTAIRILEGNKHLCLFPEAQHVGMKSMLSHKKAIPRIAFMAGKRTNYQLDIQVVPVGIYYSHYWKFRRTIVINYGKPIPVRDYYPIIEKEGEQKATIALRNKIYEELKKLIVHVEDKENYKRFSKMLNLLSPILDLKKKAGSRMEAEQKTESLLEETVKKDEQEKNMLFNLADRIETLENKLHINDDILVSGVLSWPKAICNILISLILLPVFLFGAIINGPIFWATRYPYRKNIKDPQFWSSVSYGISIVAYPIWYLIIFFVMHWIFSSWLFAFIALLLFVPTGIIAWEVARLFTSTIARMQYRIKLNDKEKLHVELQNLYQSLVSKFTKFSHTHK